LQSVHHTLPLPFLPPRGRAGGGGQEGSSHSAPDPAWGPSHGRQFSMNLPSMDLSHGLQLFTSCPTMGSSHGVQSFRSRLLQRGSPRGHKSCQQTCSSVGSPQGHSLLRASPCSRVGSSPGCRWVSAPLWASMGCRGTACLTMVCSTGFSGTSAPMPGAPPAPPSALTVGSAGLVFSHHLTPLFRMLLHSNFSPFLTMLS